MDELESHKLGLMVSVDLLVAMVGLYLLDIPWQVWLGASVGAGIFLMLVSARDNQITMKMIAVAILMSNVAILFLGSIKIGWLVGCWVLLSSLADLGATKVACRRIGSHLNEIAANHTIRVTTIDVLTWISQSERRLHRSQVLRIGGFVLVMMLIFLNSILEPSAGDWNFTSPPELIRLVVLAIAVFVPLVTYKVCRLCFNYYEEALLEGRLIPPPGYRGQLDFIRIHSNDPLSD